MKYDVLKKLRKERNISLQEMADALGLKTAGGYKRIETGENKLKAEHLPVIANKFEIPLETLMSLLFDTKVDESSNFKGETA